MSTKWLERPVDDAQEANTSDALTVRFDLYFHVVELHPWTRMQSQPNIRWSQLHPITSATKVAGAEYDILLIVVMLDSHLITSLQLNYQWGKEECCYYESESSRSAEVSPFWFSAL